jgi:hypothetical protein
MTKHSLEREEALSRIAGITRDTVSFRLFAQDLLAKREYPRCQQFGVRDVR